MESLGRWQAPKETRARDANNPAAKWESGIQDCTYEAGTTPGEEVSPAPTALHCEAPPWVTATALPFPAPPQQGCAPPVTQQLQEKIRLHFQRKKKIKKNEKPKNSTAIKILAD